MDPLGACLLDINAFCHPCQVSKKQADNSHKTSSTMGLDRVVLVRWGGPHGMYDTMTRKNLINRCLVFLRVDEDQPHPSAPSAGLASLGSWCGRKIPRGRPSANRQSVHRRGNYQITMYGLLRAQSQTVIATRDRWILEETEYLDIPGVSRINHSSFQRWWVRHDAGFHPTSRFVRILTDTTHLACTSPGASLDRSAGLSWDVAHGAC